VRGKFHRPGAKLNLPVYLEPPMQAWLAGVARKKGEEINTLVNRLLKQQRALAKGVD
jgi:hypothetical protein